MRRALVLLVTVGALTGCGRSSPGASPTTTGGMSPSGASTSSATSEATPSSPGPPPDAVTRALTPQAPIHVVNLSGEVVGTVPVPTDGSATSGVGRHHLWVAEGKSLAFYGAGGAKLATDAFSDAGFSSPPVFSADGSHWVWSSSPDQADTQRGSTTTIYMGTQTSQMTPIATSTRSPGTRLTPIAWVNGRVYLTEYVVVGGGRSVISIGTGAWSLDPSTGALAELAPSCHLQDVATDGSLLCIQGQILTVIHPGGGTSELVVTGSWDETGAAHFSADGRMVAASAISFEPSLGATFMGSATGGSLEKVADDAFGVYFLPDGRFLAQTSAGWVVENQDGTKSALPLPDGDTVMAVLADPAD